MKTLVKKEQGQSLVEYALIIALVAIVLVAGLTALQGGVSTAFTNCCNGYVTAAPPTSSCSFAKATRLPVSVTLPTTTGQQYR